MLIAICSILSIIGVIGFFLGFPIMAYIGGIASIVENSVELGSGRQTSAATLWIAILIGIGFAITSSYAWWQGILIACSFEGAFMILYSLKRVIEILKSE
jgi:hypothetical protein